ncbi:MAG TPA: phosphatidate cytidylyltransferase [Candidatus Limnocylindria bacterium]|nr:phosphatidate cytidylyltransferase [Candidatus Limnocylindria bacterium]
MLRTRVLTAAVLAPAVLAAAYLGEPWLSIVLALLAFFALAELIALLDAAGFAPPQVLGLAAGLATTCAGLVAANSGNVGGLLNALLSATQPPGLVAVAFAGSLVLLALAAFTRGEPGQGFLTWSTTSFGIAYVGLLLPFVALVAQLGPGSGAAQGTVGWLGLRSGTAWLLMLILVVWGYDTGAYLTGRWLGRRRLIGHISPSKTVEGVAGGLVVATLAAGLGAGLTGLAPWHPLLIGPVVGGAAQAGDLAESMLKRAADRKESGFLIPGHGGILDRIDSFLFAAPVLFGYALLVARVAP